MRGGRSQQFGYSADSELAVSYLAYTAMVQGRHNSLETGFLVRRSSIKLL
jgi:hypothetical protein